MDQEEVHSLITQHLLPPGAAGNDGEVAGHPLVFKDRVEPHTIYTPVSVPHHWKHGVNEGLDQDVRLGIIEPVPAGTLTT